MEDLKPLKDLLWAPSTKRDLLSFPKEIVRGMGYALHQAQEGKRSDKAKTLQGFGGGGVIEVVESDEHGTYRAVYTVKFEEVVYVLHAFQKKSKQGIKTPQQDIDLIRQRLKWAEEDHFKRQKPKGTS